MHPFLPRLSLAAACALSLGASFNNDFNEEFFDYIIVGAGTAGSMVASQLATNMPHKQILLIEEGYYSNANPDIDDASLFYLLQNDATIEKFYYSTPQSGLNDRSIHLPRARVTGGCNSHNYQTWILANEHDLSERWGNIDGWTLDDILPIWDEIQSVAYHGTSFYDPSNPDPMMARMIQAGVNIGNNINYNWNEIDASKGQTQEGICGAIYESEIIEMDDGSYYFKRHSAWTDYVEPILATQTNLHILTMTRVDKLLFDETNDHNKHRISGVLAYHRGKLKTLTFYAREEVIISGGTYDTPKLLMLSGIGDCNLLENEYNIECKANVPGIGQNLRDHFIIAVSPIVLFTNTSELDYRKKLGYDFWGAGIVGEKGEYLSVFSISNIDASTDTWGLQVFSFLHHLYSVGNVTLKDNNAVSQPIIEHNYMIDERDGALGIRAVKAMREYVFDSGDAFDGVLDNDDAANEIKPGYSVQSDDEILQYVKEMGISGSHCVGTCKMGDNVDSDDMIVVNQRLKVVNFENLRVIDASIMPHTISANTNAMTMVIGMKGARMIVQDYNNCNNNNNNDNNNDDDNDDDNQ